MRIAMIIEAWEPIWGGGQVHVYEICKRLVTHGVKIDLYVMALRDTSGRVYNENEELFDGKLRIIRVGFPKSFTFMNRIIWAFEVMWAILSNHRKTPYSLIHAHANLPGLPAKILSRLLNVPVVYTVHGSGIEALEKMYGKGFKSRILYLFEVFLQRKIEYDIEITVDRKFLKYYNVNNPVYIPNGVDIEKFDRTNVQKGKMFKILFVGRIHPQKGLRCLVKAVNKIKNEFDYNLGVIAIVGGDTKWTNEEKIVRTLIKKLGLEKYFIFRGRLPEKELLKEYKSSMLFVLPSLFEGMPLTLLEAWASKLPVLATKVGENPYLIMHKYNGWLVEPGEVNDLAKALKDLLNTPKRKLEIMGKRGYSLVKDRYSWDRIVDDIYNIYLWVISYESANNFRR
ncbi:glycosyltransferase family 4 protein [Thermococcus sp. 9N3]|uniref:glycosyltransferase family 4 protein n=1 Tax=Thermococcus sp. 9N3 TaxID=163002 RepID=UPI0014304228|nr:glycosyltransferase family 4 protein [Thermococcus sp. 9N3]NJE49567.1 glycosyltransferase family 1 protein [Thermococcus sp. 9N3]